MRRVRIKEDTMEDKERWRSVLGEWSKTNLGLSGQLGKLWQYKTFQLNNYKMIHLARGLTLMK